MSPNEYMAIRQRAYNRLADKFVITDPTSMATLAIHKQIIAELDKLPVREGGVVLDDSGYDPLGGLLFEATQTAYIPPAKKDRGNWGLYILGFILGLIGLAMMVPSTWVLWAWYH